MKRFLAPLAAVAASLAIPVASAQAVSGGQFSVACTYDHTLLDDPIVFPGHPGMSHSHDFAGSRSTNAFSTGSSLLSAGATTCSRPEDLSGYWVPTLMQNGVPVHPREFRAYYRGAGFDGSVVRPFPKGLRMIAGNSKVTDAGPYQPVSIASWACTLPGGGDEGNEIEVEDVPADCGGQSLRARLVFPQCWNGVDLDSPDHKSHMAYAVHGKCPATHPVIVPQLTMSLRYWVPNTSGISLASGGSHSLHADFMIGWTGTKQEDLVRTCIRAGVDCGNAVPVKPSVTAVPPPKPTHAVVPPKPTHAAAPPKPARAAAPRKPTRAPARRRAARRHAKASAALCPLAQSSL